VRGVSRLCGLDVNVTIVNFYMVVLRVDNSKSNSKIQASCSNIIITVE
jgi:hypothetical protein